MLWFNETKDFGFISTDEGERLYVHGSGFGEGQKPHGRCAGLVVDFRVTGMEERKAEQVFFIVEEAPRRARRHYHGRGVLS